MTSVNWKKVENEAGYPLYIDETTGKQQLDHPEYSKIIKSMEVYDGIKYSVYRNAYKIFILQKHLRVPPFRISSGVFSRHQLSLSESSLSLETAELEAVLADIYFAAEKEGLFSGDVDLAVDLLINLLLCVYDKERKEPIKVLAIKTLLVILSEESASDKWLALANCFADHNGCVSSRRLNMLLTLVSALPEYLGSYCDSKQDDEESLFNQSAGMLGLSARAVAEWGVTKCVSARWLGVLQRVAASRGCAGDGRGCSMCTQPLVQVLKFKCSKCREVYFCEKCYLYYHDLTKVNGHKRTHVVHEIIDGQAQLSESKFMRGMKRLFFCTKSKKKTKAISKKADKENQGPARRRKDGKPAIFTSTVGKASGNKGNNPTCMLQDIIMQLETQNKALKELSTQLQEATKENDDALKTKVDEHYTHISMQINRLKVLKENLSINPQGISMEVQKPDNHERPQAFDLFSPIPVFDEKQSKVADNVKNQPRVLSLDSGNFSVVSTKQTDSHNLLTISGDAMKPVVVHATSDSISNVSMNDISNWYNAETAAPAQKFAADLRSVERSNRSMRALNAELDAVLDRLQALLSHNFSVDESSFDNTQLRETATEMEGLLGTLIRGVEQRATLTAQRAAGGKG